MNNTITIQLDCYGALQSSLGGPRQSLDLDAPHTPARLIEAAASRWPGAADLLARTACARGDSLLAPDTQLADGDIVALIPPVSGGQAEPRPTLTDEPLDLAALMSETEDEECGALVVFGGTVRLNNNDREVDCMDYSAYGPLAARTLAEIEAETIGKYDARACRIQHRTGQLKRGETSVYIVVRAKHRAEAFTAARFAIEALKARVAIWKNEYYSDGSSAYLEGTEVPHAERPRGAGE